MNNTRENLLDLLQQGNEMANKMCGEQDGCEKCQYQAPKGCAFGFIADHLIANGVTVQKWIPVTERLPEKYKDVLVYRLTGCEVTCCTDIKNKKWFGDEICCYEVTHWMPLPEPPKGE